jgi:hypothetical protein
LDSETPLRDPVRISNRYPERIQPFTRVRELINFAHRQAESGNEGWKHVYLELLKASTGADLALAVARFKAAADSQRWLGR